MKEVRTFHVQGWLDSIGNTVSLSRNTLKHIKTFISAIFKLAKQQGYYMGENPVRDTATSPKATAPQETYAYNLTEIQQMLSVHARTRSDHLCRCCVHRASPWGIARLAMGRLRTMVRFASLAPFGKATLTTRRRSKKGAPVPVIKSACTNAWNCIGYVAKRRENEDGEQRAEDWANVRHQQKHTAEHEQRARSAQILPVAETLRRPADKARRRMRREESEHDYKLDDAIPCQSGGDGTLARRGFGKQPVCGLGVPEIVIQRDTASAANVSTTSTYHIKTVATSLTERDGET